jgi:hypothetical protein
MRQEYRLKVSAAELAVLHERDRQIEKEGFSSERDDGYVKRELAMAAASYAWIAGFDDDFRKQYPARRAPDVWWPWGKDWWKPKDHRSDLVRAAALIIAEIERIDRSALRTRKD